MCTGFMEKSRIYENVRTILSRYRLDLCLPSLLFLVNADAMHVLLNEDFGADDIKLNFW